MSEQLLRGKLRELRQLWMDSHRLHQGGSSKQKEGDRLLGLALELENELVNMFLSLDQKANERIIELTNTLQQRDTEMVELALDRDRCMDAHLQTINSTLEAVSKLRKAINSQMEKKDE